MGKAQPRRQEKKKCSTSSCPAGLPAGGRRSQTAEGCSSGADRARAAAAAAGAAALAVGPRWFPRPWAEGGEWMSPGVGRPPAGRETPRVEEAEDLGFRVVLAWGLVGWVSIGSER